VGNAGYLFSSTPSTQAAQQSSGAAAKEGEEKKPDQVKV